MSAIFVELNVESHLKFASVTFEIVLYFFLTSSSLELIKHNIVTICKQLVLRCIRSQHLNTRILY